MFDDGVELRNGMTIQETGLSGIETAFVHECMTANKTSVFDLSQNATEGQGHYVLRVW